MKPLATCIHDHGGNVSRQYRAYVSAGGCNFPTYHQCQIIIDRVIFNYTYASPSETTFPPVSPFHSCYILRLCRSDYFTASGSTRSPPFSQSLRLPQFAYGRIDSHLNVIACYWWSDVDIPSSSLRTDPWLNIFYFTFEYNHANVLLPNAFTYTRIITHSIKVWEWHWYGGMMRQSNISQEWKLKCLLL